MSARSTVLAVGPGFCWQVYEMRVGDNTVEGAALYLERRDDGLRGLLRRDSRGWHCIDFHGNRMNVPASVIDALRGTAPYGAYLLEEQHELAFAERHGRRIRGVPRTGECPSCGDRVLVA